MKKIKFLFIATILSMFVASCASSDNNKNVQDSVIVESEVVASNDSVDAASDNANAVITYTDKATNKVILQEIPANGLVTPATVQATGHVTVIEFGATWCGPCKQAKPIVEELAAKYSGKAEFLYADIEKCAKTAEAFGVGQNIPVVVVATPDGKFEVVTGLGDIKSQLENKIATAIK